MAEVEDSDKYIQGWTNEMLVIWREKIERFGIIRSGKLHGSLDSFISKTAEGSLIQLAFVRYGIYQAFGVGFGYSHSNGGDLEFLSPEYRRQHHLDVPKRVGPVWGGGFTSGNPRKKRDWFHPKLYVSRKVLAEALTRIHGEIVAAMISRGLEGG